MRRTGWLVLIFGTGLVASNIIPPDERCVTAIYNAYDYISFAGSPPAGFWGTRCLNPLKVTSIYASTEVHCSSSAQAAGLSQLATLCRQVAHLELIPRDKLATNLTSDQIQRMRVVDYEEISRHQRIDAPVILSSAYYSRTFQTIVGFYLLSPIYDVLILVSSRMLGNSKPGHIMRTGRSEHTRLLSSDE